MKKSELINNRERAKQILGFDGMQYGRCRPTDIDCSVDFQGNVFVFTELKGRKAPLTLGQKIHLMSLVDAIEAGGKQAYAVLAHHNTPDTNHDVHVAESIVDAVYTLGSWHKAYTGETLDKFISGVHTEYLLDKAEGKV